MAEGLPRSFDTDKTSDDKKKEKDEGGSSRRQEVAERLGRAAEARALGGAQPEREKPRQSLSEQVAAFLKSAIELPGGKSAEAPREKPEAGEPAASDHARQEAGAETPTDAADHATGEADHDVAQPADQAEAEPEQAAEAVQQGVLENLDRRAEQIRYKLDSDPPLAEERQAAAADKVFIEGATEHVHEAADEPQISEGIQQAFAETAAQEGLDISGATSETADGEPLTAAAAMEYQAEPGPEPADTGPAEQAAEIAGPPVEPLPFPLPEQAAADTASHTEATPEDPASYGAARMAAGGGHGGIVPPAGPALPQWHYNQPPAAGGPNMAPPLATERVVEVTRPNHNLAWFLAGGAVGAWLMHRHDRKRTAREVAGIKQEHAKQFAAAEQVHGQRLAEVQQEHGRTVQTLHERIAAINQEVTHNEALLRAAAYEREGGERQRQAQAEQAASERPAHARPVPEASPAVAAAERSLRAAEHTSETAAAGVAAGAAAAAEALHYGPGSSERPAAQAAYPEVRSAERPKAVELMTTEELTAAAEAIVVGMTNVRRVFETHLISERGLRDVIREFQRGGDFRLELQKAILEKEQSYELDPQLRDHRAEPERPTAGAGAGAPAGGGQATSAAARPTIVEYDSPAPIMPVPRDPRAAAVRKKQNALLVANAVALGVLVVLLIVLFVVQG